jgi:hypothetical protein
MFRGDLYRYSITIVVVLILATPALAKGHGDKMGKTKDNYALLFNLVTGECQITKLGFQAEPPEGFRLLGNYESQKTADAAEVNSSECKASAGVHAGDATAIRAEKDCNTEAQKSASTLLGLFSGPSKHSIFVECMKRQGFDVK